jgi:hypothetical protein
MKIKYLISEDKSYFKKVINDPRMSNLLAIAFKMDSKVPRPIIAKLGPRPTNAEIVELLSEKIPESLRNTTYGNADDGKFNEWITRLYSGGGIDYEDLVSRLPDELAGFRALSMRNLLPSEWNDINKFRSHAMLTHFLGKYSAKLSKIQDEAKVEEAKRDQKYLTLIDNDDFFVGIPLNYGACYVFNMGEGVPANFCTGSSSGLYFFTTYSRSGPIIMIFNKKNQDTPDSKWQLHIETSQLQNAPQRYNSVGDSGRRFGEVYPGLMKKIVKKLEDDRTHIEEKGREFNFSWKIGNTIDRIRSGINLALNDEPEEKKDQPATP